jgi:arylsulfatase A
MMEELDQGVGRVLDAIDQLKIADNTYVMFTADNGGRGTLPGGSKNRLEPNDPLTGAKHSLYEGGIRVPFIVRGPGVQAGSFCHTPVVGYDYLPTFYELAGGKQAKEKLTGDVDGVSFTKLFADPSETSLGRPDNVVYFHRPNKSFSAMRQGPHKLMLFWKPDGTVARHELYRLDKNPREDGHQITNKEPKQAEAMKTTLLAFLESVGAEKRVVNMKKRKKK